MTPTLYDLADDICEILDIDPDTVEDSVMEELVETLENHIALYERGREVDSVF